MQIIVMLFPYYFMREPLFLNPEIIVFRHSDNAPVSQGNTSGHGTIGTRKQGNFNMALHDTAAYQRI